MATADGERGAVSTRAASGQASGEARSEVVGWLLLLLVLFAFGLRAWAGSVGLDSAHNWDERFTLNNVKAFLRDGRFEPANAYYPSLSYLPQLLLLSIQHGLHRLTGADSLAVFGSHGFSPAAYLVCRWWMALCGALSVALTFRVGRRVAEALGEARPRWVGLAAAALVAALPVHVDLSAQIKPDIVVFLLALVAFDGAFTAVLGKGRRANLWAGVGVGLAVAAKYTGVGAALPLVFGQLAGAWRDARRWKGLIVAGLAAVASFVLLNPFLLSIFEYLPKLAEIYERKGEEAGGSHLGVFRAELAFLFRQHGSVIAVVALLALAWLATRAFRSGQESHRRVIALLLGWPVGYSLLYGLVTTLFKGQNYLPVAAFTSVAAALALVAVADVVQEKAPVPATQWALGLGSAVAAMWLFKPSVELTYQAVIPSTYGRAAELLAAELAPLERHALVFERSDVPLRFVAGAFRPGTWVTDNLETVGSDRLDLADAELFLASRLDSPAANFLRQRLAAPGARVHHLASKLGWAHGPKLLAVLHVWKEVGEPETLLFAAESPGRYQARVASPSTASVVSLSLMLPQIEGGGRLRVAGRLLPLLLTQGRGGKGWFLTPRFELAAGSDTLALELPDHPQAPSEVEARLHRWSPPS